MPNVTAEMLQADYWINKIADPDRVILDTAAIAKPAFGYGSGELL